MRYGMVIDLRRCIGCHACVMACKLQNSTLPTIFWCRVLEKEIGEFPLARIFFLPVLCNHCKNPPCRDVCPTGATVKQENGLVLCNYNKCIGCRACIVACPYEARYYVKEIYGYFPGDLTQYEKYGYKKHQKGVVQKCTFCNDRIEEGLEPACVETCPPSCRYFGDLEDPNSKVSQLVCERGGIQLRPEQGADPSVYYLF